MSLAFRTIRTYFATLWQFLFQNERQAIRTALIFSTMFASFALGIMVVDTIMMSWWPILLWLLLVIICFVFLWPHKKVELRFERSFFVLTGLIFLAFFLRFVDLGGLPPAFTLDEMGTADFTIRHVAPSWSQTISPFRTGNDSQPTLYFYLLRLTMALGGFEIAATRISSVIAGTLAVAATFFLVDTISGRRMAWFSALVMTTYHYHIHWSRIALNNIWTTLWVPLVLALFAWGWKKRWSGAVVLSGLCLGLSAYFYQGGYILIFLMVFLVFKTWRETQEKFELTVYSLKTIAMAWVTVSPILAFALLHPEMYSDRLRVIWGWSREAMAIAIGPDKNFLEYAWHQLIHSFGAFNIYTDATGFYAPGTPLLVGLASPLFLVGVVWAVYRRQWMPLVWLLLTIILGGFLLSAPPGSSHYVVSIPAVCWLLGIALNGLYESRYRWWAFAFLIAVITVDSYFYFSIYRSSPSPDYHLPFPEIRPEHFQ